MGLLEAEARRLNAPYLKLLRTGRPWVLAKWAMTLDGKTATRSRLEPLDLQRAVAGRLSTSCGAGWTRSSSAARRPGATIRS